MQQDVSYDLGPQPLDDIITKLNLTNTDLVKVSTEQLSHKMVLKGRKGRRLTRNIQEKILRALNAAVGEEKYGLKDLFNY